MDQRKNGEVGITYCTTHYVVLMYVSLDLSVHVQNM